MDTFWEFELELQAMELELEQKSFCRIWNGIEDAISISTSTEL